MIECVLLEKMVILELFLFFSLKKKWLQVAEFVLKSGLSCSLQLQRVLFSYFVFFFFFFFLGFML